MSSSAVCLTDLKCFSSPSIKNQLTIVRTYLVLFINCIVLLVTRILKSNYANTSPAGGTAYLHCNIIT